MSKGFLPLLFTLAAAHSFLNSNEVTENEVQQSLMDNLVTDVEMGPKWAEIHQALLPTYNALPKNSQGLIDHQAVRYVLHRMFVQKYGWYIKGLEPSGDNWHEETPEKLEVVKVKEWVPTYLQDLLEKRLHHKGLDLKGLVQLALSLEELVSHEAKNRLKTAYQIHDFPTSGEMARIEADDVVRTWYVSFLLAGNFSASSPEEVHSKKAIFARRYSDWQDADNWLGELEKEHYQGISAPTFESNFDLVQKIGERYFRFNDGECRALKATMQDMEGKKAGRVRLSTFYKKSLDSHWRFTEKADYLRRLGALDDSDPQQPQVIMAPPLAMDGKKVVAAAVATSACAAYASRSFVASGPAITANQVHKSSFAGAQPATSARAARGHIGAALALPAAGLVAAGRWQRKGRRHARVVRCADGLADCPYVLYGKKDIDVEAEREKMKVKACPLEIRMPPELKGDLEGQRQFFSSRLPDIYKDLKEYGAIVFRGFEISKDKGTFGQVGQALQLEPCEDPLHSVAARDAVDKKAGVYEAVNKPSRSKFYIGMHNEMVGDRAPGAALFVCFKAAEEGGEFLVADGRKMFKELDKEWLTKVYNRDVVYSTAEFPMGFIEGLPDFVQPAVEPMVYGAMTQALKMKVDFKTELRWEKSDYDGSKILQVQAMPQYPVLRHHATGEPCWWGSMQSHAEHLRSEREKVYGEAQETTGASRINKTDVFYGDDGEKIETEWLEHLDKVTLDCAEKVKMEEGDMVLLDNYLVMHGRCPFEGTRLHAVSWFKSPDYSKAAA